MSTRPDVNAGGTETPSNVLLLAPSVGSGADAVCRELLETPGSVRTHALLVTCLESPAERLSAWTGRSDERPARTTVVDVEAEARSSAKTASAGAASGAVPNATVEHVPDPTDLIALGETLDRHLSATKAGEATALCFHSLTTLLQATDRESVFKFLEVLTSTVDRTDAVGHYHMNPDVHDPDTIATLEVLFDAVVDLRTDAPADE